MLAGLAGAKFLDERANDGESWFRLVICVGDAEEVEEVRVAGGIRVGDVAKIEEGVALDVEEGAECVDGAYNGVEGFGLLGG